MRSRSYLSPRILSVGLFVFGLMVFLLLPRLGIVQRRFIRHSDAVPVLAKSKPAWLKVSKADPSLFTPKRKIDDGEREAFALALGLKADAVLLDDIKLEELSLVL